MKKIFFLILAILALSSIACAQGKVYINADGTLRGQWQISKDGALIKWNRDSLSYKFVYNDAFSTRDSAEVLMTKNPRGSHIYQDIMGRKWFKKSTKIDTLVAKYFKLNSGRNDIATMGTGDIGLVTSGSPNYISFFVYYGSNGMAGRFLDSLASIRFMRDSGQAKTLKGIKNLTAADSGKILTYGHDGWQLKSIDSIGFKNYWVIDGDYLKPDTSSRVVDLRNNKLQLPQALNDEGQLAYMSSKIKYEDNSGTKFLASEGFVSHLIDSLGGAFSSTSFWLNDDGYLKPDSVIFIVDLQGKKLRLPESLDDTGQLAFTDDVLKYFSSDGAQTVASRNWVAYYFDSVYTPTLFADPLYTSSDSVRLSFNDPFYLSTYNGALSIRTADSTHTGVLSSTKYAQIMAGLGPNIILDTATVSLTKTWSAHKIFTELEALYDDLDNTITGYATSASGYNVHWDNVTNKPSFYTLPSGAETGTYSVLNEVGEEVIFHFTNGVFTGQTSGTGRTKVYLKDMITDAINQHVIDAH